MNELALFAGAGGGLLGSKLLGWRTVCYVERDPYCVEVLKARMRDGYLDDAPIWDDCNTFDGRPWAGSVDIVTAGFPCQHFSNAGKRLEDRDSRNGWPATIRIIREVRPRFLLLENVAGLLSKSYIRRIFGDLAESGYLVRWDCLPASIIGAPHLRKRIYIVAHSKCERWTETGIYPGTHPETHPENAVIKNWGGMEPGICTEIYGRAYIGIPEDLRVDDGLAAGVDRIRALGNGQVPAMVRYVWNKLSKF